MKLYLAHQLKKRKEIREWELDFEEKTGIELINPFYDCPNREDIKIIDSFREGSKKQTEFLKSRDYLECRTIIERDLELIRKSDGLVAFVTKSIGTSMEIIMAYRLFKIPTYIITDKYYMHAWIQANSTKIFKNKEDFEDYVCHTLKIEQKEKI
jgi:nucleoside 2-deoxyribosyltransferase